MVENVTTPGARSLTLTIRGDAANGADWWGESSGTVPHQDEGFPFWSVNAEGDRLVAAGVRSDGRVPQAEPLADDLRHPCKRPQNRHFR